MKNIQAVDSEGNVVLGCEQREGQKRELANKIENQFMWNENVTERENSKNVMSLDIQRDGFNMAKRPLETV